LKQVLICFAALVALAFNATSAQADVLTITPDNTCTTSNNSNLNAGALYGILDGCFGVEADTLSLLYKVNVDGGGESGAFTTSYKTTFSNTSSDPENALIEYVGGPAIGCVECYLVVKDGNHQPAQYFFDLAALNWNGTDSLYLKGFWPQGGAISNVAVWGTTQQVPEPGTLLLLGTGAAVALVRRRRALRA
jgi:hypothetical protein